VRPCKVDAEGCGAWGPLGSAACIHRIAEGPCLCSRFLVQESPGRSSSTKNVIAAFYAAAVSSPRLRISVSSRPIFQSSAPEPHTQALRASLWHESGCQAEYSVFISLLVQPLQ
jgi:hypothetical protein